MQKLLTHLFVFIQVLKSSVNLLFKQPNDPAGISTHTLGQSAHYTHIIYSKDFDFVHLNQLTFLNDPAGQAVLGQSAYLYCYIIYLYFILFCI